MKHEQLTNLVDIHLGDCLDILPTLGQYDLIFADPPYNLGKDYDNHDDNMPHDEYISFIQTFINLAEKKTNSLAMYPPKLHLLEFWNMLPKHHLLICGYSAQGSYFGRFFHQYIALLVPCNPKKSIPDHWYNIKLPSLGFYYHEKRFDHPAQTSLDLTTRIIDAFTLPGQSVLDPFGGTGTTAIACTQLGRSCTLIEKSPTYYDLARNRILEFIPQLSFLEVL